MDPQEGDIADLPDGRTAVRQGGRWVVQGGAQAQPGPAGIPGFVPFQSPSDQRADRRLDLTEETAARSTRNEERAIANDERVQGRQGVQSESDMRREFAGLKDVQDYAIVRAAYQNVAATANNASAAGDLSLIFAYMKMLDPTSAVRETEFANAQNAAGVPDQVRNQWNRIMSGERLNPEQRQDFVAQAQSLYSNREARYNQLADWYTGLASRYGYDPAGVVMPEEAAPQIQPAQQPGVVGREQQYEGVAYQAPFTGPGSSPDNPYVLRDVETGSPEDVSQRRDVWGLSRGMYVRQPNGEIAQITADPYEDQNAPNDQGMGGVNTRMPNLPDQARAFAMGAAEQVPGLDEAAVGAAGMISGRGYSDVRDSYRAAQSIDNQANRGQRIAGGLAGAGMMMVAPGGNIAGKFLASAPKGMAVARGMMVGGGSGAVYGAGAADGGLSERFDGARDGAFVGAMTGGMLAGGGRRIGEAANRPPSARAIQVQTLRDNGVSLTPGQMFGGPVQTVENLAQRAPILGTAIRGARERGVESLNRAVGNRALDNIGEGVPAGVPVGGEMVGYVRDRLGSEFDRAYSLVPQIDVNDPALVQGLTRIGQTKADLPPAMQQQFDSIVSERLARLEGATTGQNVGAVRSELNSLASGYLRAQDPAQQALGRMIAELGDELDGAISRASPEAGEILGRAREGYSDYVRLERASTAAGGRPFSPGQLETAVRASDGSVRRGAMGRGEARMQDLSSAARTVMPDSFGNPGTADAIGLGALGAGALTQPVTTGAVAGGLAVAATPYLMMGRRVVERLPSNASREALQEADAELAQLARQDSNVIVLRDEIAKRLAAVSGVAGGNAPQATERLMTGARSTATSPR